ncbi:FGGY-family carbohydrate kinase [Deinococcus deserti]|uniref:Putative xylulokinase n=1 Tax=Deinococcus deserti (strain DSM 17065 / CIP 109153 / LMG 22923 / VCD115) TaxID=546414 RepID=C1D436_DEIDV|nr:FGGY-family carbohydrate kinase [Deinococcus deserti]ACO47917.2 putative xylulokinase [Deinococcus deserti VCD115]
MTAGSPVLLGLDIGTYSSKGVLVGVDGRIVAQHVIAHQISMPAPGHVEQDADAVWWGDAQTLIRTLLQGVDPARVVGVACSAIGPTLLPLDERGAPLRPGILYGVDTRAGAQIDAMNHDLGEDQVFLHSNMALTSQAIGPKIRWLREHEPALWARTRTLTTASSYLVYRLTGRHVMDHHTGAHFMPLYDPRTRQWSETFRAAVLADRGLDLLPDLAWSDERAGVVTAEAGALTGLRPGTPVAVGTVDALAEAISVGATQPGDLMVMYGSTTFFVLVQTAPTPDPRVWSVGGAFPGQVNLAAGMGTTGSLTRWMADEFARELPTDQAYDALFAEAARIDPGADGLLMLPYLSGERTPINDPRARGVIAGLTLTHTRGHLFRAALEGVGFGIRHNLEAFSDLGADIRRVIAVGGGTKGRVWLQIVSDITGVSQEMAQISLGASYGDAFLAGRAAGVLAPEELQRWIQPAEPVVPNMAAKRTYDRLYPLYRDLYTTTASTVHALSQ